jgi:hypothetical protein
LKGEWEQAVAPARDVQRRFELMRTVQQAKEQAGQLLGQARHWPLFEALRADIATAMQANPQLSLHDAYLQTFSAKGMSLAEQQWKASYQGQVSTKAAATTTVPGATPATPKAQRDLSLRELVSQEFDR